MESFIAPEQLERPDFLIRGYLPGDGAALNDALAVSYAHLEAFMPWAQREQTVEQSERFVRESRARYLLAENFNLAVFDPSGTEILGGSGYHLREGGLEQRNAEIGMWIRADAAGRGLGTAVLVALLEWGFTQWPWLRLSWRCDALNVASDRCARNAGMVHEGTLRGHANAIRGNGRRDTMCFAALRGEWAPPLPSGTENGPG